MNFVQRNLPDKFSLDEKNINRIDLRNIIFREIVANLLIHREFSSSFEAKFLIFSDKIITENWNKPLQFGNITIENWTSHTKNPLIAKVFRELKWVEELGSGKKNILKFASLYFDNQAITIKDDDKFVFEIDFNEFTPQDTPQDKQDTPQDAPQDEQQNSTQLLKLIKVLIRDMSREELMNALSISDREYFREFFIKPALEKGWIEMTIPTKPNSKNQKYRKVILGEFSEITPQDTPQVTPQDEVQHYERLQRLVKALKVDMTREELMNALSITDREHFREYYLKPALKKRWITMTIPSKPTSKNQKYRRIKKL
jgi:predicted HTH transcriptional regulator